MVGRTGETVVDDGTAWNGATYASASAVAFAITGTKWSGHRVPSACGIEMASARAKRQDDCEKD